MAKDLQIRFARRARTLTIEKGKERETLRGSGGEKAGDININTSHLCGLERGYDAKPYMNFGPNTRMLLWLGLALTVPI